MFERACDFSCTTPRRRRTIFRRRKAVRVRRFRLDANRKSATKQRGRAIIKSKLPMNKNQACQPNLKSVTAMTPSESWQPARPPGARMQATCWLTLLLVLIAFSPARSDDQRTAGAAATNLARGGIQIFDQYGRPSRSGRRPAGGQTFDVTVGPQENKFTFSPDTLNISVGDTVRWTWASDSHSVTSGTDCTPNGQFCSPDNTNCDAGILNNTGFVYEHTFTQAGTYSYFCFLHCFAGMTGVVNVVPNQRATPTPRPRPTPHPRPVGPVRP